MHLFKAQIDKTNEKKLLCLMTFADPLFTDKEKFWLLFMEKVAMLVLNCRYEAQCNYLGIDPEILAEHIVFLGNPTINKVLAQGIEPVLKDEWELYRKRFTDPAVDEFRKYSRYYPESRFRTARHGNQETANEQTTN